MRSRALVPVLALALLAALPAAAEVYSINLSNGTTFQTRYQPKQAAWDPSVLTFVDETGLEVALPRAMVSSVTALSETKGFGKLNNTTTIDLGFAPNDLPEQQRQAQAAQQAMNGGFFDRSFTQQQFVDPSQTSGIPVYGFGGGGSGVFPNPSAPSGTTVVGTPPPFSAGQPTGGTPPPFTTTPTTSTPAPFTSGQPTGGTPPPFTTSPVSPGTTGTTSPQ
jgi:hypothetical protein